MIADCHSHILPGIDDGSRNTAETAQLLSQLKAAGTDSIVLTPHYYVYEQSVDEFCVKREMALKKLSALNEASGMRFSLASEVFIIDLLFNLESLDGLKIGNSRYILAELPPEDRLTDEAIRNIERLMINYNLTPVIAHIDRYPYLCNEKTAYKLREMGCLIQMNILSLANRHGRRKLLKLLEGGYIDFFGSDLHRSPFNSENYSDALRIISKKAPSIDFSKMKNEALEAFFS